MAENHNPALLHGYAIRHAEKIAEGRGEILHPREKIDLRVYDLSGSGYYFIHGHGPGKWYQKNAADDDHFCNCDIEDVSQAIDAGGRVQIVGPRGISFGIWENFQKFLEEMTAK